MAFCVGLTPNFRLSRIDEQTMCQVAKAIGWLKSVVGVQNRRISAFLVSAFLRRCPSETAARKCQRVASCSVGSLYHLLAMCYVGHDKCVMTAVRSRAIQYAGTCGLPFLTGIASEKQKREAQNAFIFECPCSPNY